VKVAILGAGAWGTALGCMAVAAGHEPLIWTRRDAVADMINARHEHPGHLPGLSLPDTLAASSRMDAVLKGAGLILAATPAQTTREVLALAAPFVPSEAVVILCAKGIERETGLFQSAVARACLPNASLGVLSGPGFAADIASKLPTAVTIAAPTRAAALQLASLLSNARFRCYASDDMTGVEAGGALKNVIAIAAGAVHGAALGASASAALVTRGFAELRRLGVAVGGKSETLNGLSGLGDLILTCSSAQSRNFAFGAALGAGRRADGSKLAEGAATAHIASGLARRHGIDAPIIDAVSALIDERTTIGAAVSALMARPLRSEQE
jgi:glycerol-3-phosphate dehydrogenase (NAD(P)+)